MPEKPKRDLPTGLYRRKNKLWIRYRGPRKDGSWGEIRESADTTDLKKAAKLRSERLQDASNHRRGIRRFSGPEQERTTVGQLLDLLERDYETRRLPSLRTMKAHVAHLRAFFGFERAVRVSTARIEDYVARRREEEAAEATIDRETEKLRRALKLGVEVGLVAWVPKVPRLVKAGANAKERFVERAEFDRFLPELPSQIVRDVALWAYGTGMRLSSILSLRWDGYDRESRTIRLHGKDSKTGKGVLIPLKGWPELAAVIDRRFAERLVGCPLIFHRAGRRVGDFWLTWERACLRAEVRVFSIHDLRRVAVRNMVRAGVPERVAMAISGHRTRAIFDRYNIVSETDLAQALERRAAYENELVQKGRR